MNVFLEVNGVLYEGFETISYFKSIENLSGTFNFIASSEDTKFLPFKGQEECRIIINNKPVITGFIENLTYSYDSGSHQIIVSGRDKTADIIDNTVIGNVDFKSSMSLKNLIENVLLLAGIDNDTIQVIDLVGDLEDFKENEIKAAEVGDNMFEYIEKYCRKRAVLLSSNGNANIIITRAGSEQLNGILLNQLNNSGNNIKAAAISYDFTDRYFGYVVKSQGNFLSALLAGDDGEGLSDLESTNGSAIDTEIRRTRLIEFENETSSTNSSNLERAKWEANIRRARSKIYTCNLAHIYYDKKETEIYEPNKLIQVIDDFCDINAIMLIRSVNYQLSNITGTNITLELVAKDSYLPEPSVDEEDSLFNVIGADVNE